MPLCALRRPGGSPGRCVGLWLAFHVAYVRLAYAGVDCELGEGGLAVDWDPFGELEAVPALHADEVGSLRVWFVSHVDDPL